MTPAPTSISNFLLLALTTTLMGVLAPVALGQVVQAQVTSEVTVLTQPPAAIMIAADPAANQLTIDSESGPAELGLAEHLQKVGAIVYSSYTCIYCYRQFYAFGQQAFARLNRIECNPEGANAQPEVCDQANVPGYPTWSIKGKLYPGVQALDELANLTNYRGPRNFKKMEPQTIPERYQSGS